MFGSESDLPRISRALIGNVPPSQRLSLLALPRPEHSDSMKALSLPDPYKVKEKALNAMMSNRVKELSRPRSRYRFKDYYDPFSVLETALRYKCTPRMLELCAPLPRRQKQKANSNGTNKNSKKKSKPRPKTILI